MFTSPTVRRLILLLALQVVAGCQTAAPAPDAGKTAAAARPPLAAHLAGLVHGADAAELRRAARDLRQRGQAPAAAQALLGLLAPTATPALSDHDTRTAAELYLLLPDPAPTPLFQALVASDRMEPRRTAWQVAARYPSDDMAKAVAGELSRRATQAAQAGKDGAGISPEAALAVRANHLTEAYPLVRAALMAEGQPAYAKALIGLRPAAAADDLLAYLAGARPDDLLAGRPAGVNRTTCLVALAHLAAEPPSLHQPAVKPLFYYAASADPALAEAATAVVSRLAEAAPRDVAFLLAQMPEPVRAGVSQHLRHAGWDEGQVAALLDAGP